MDILEEIKLITEKIDKEEFEQLRKTYPYADPNRAKEILETKAHFDAMLIIYKWVRSGLINDREFIDLVRANKESIY